MKHLVLILCAALSAGVGILILVLTKAGTTPAIVGGVGLVVLSLCLAVPAQMEGAKATLVGFKDALTSVQPPRQS